jgi:pantetheine-phosphate adenylyltransferase
VRHSVIKQHFETKKEVVMNITYVYPGSFCPPTYGHLHILKKAAELFDELTIVCSDNPNKTNKWFTPEECAELWRRGYQLPANVRVTTITELKKSHLDLSQVVIVRGVRDATHFEEEKGVMFLNRKELGIDKFFYLMSDPEYCHISSSKARQAATSLAIEHLAEYVSPLVITALLEHVLELKGLYMVVGKPGSGKSTFFQALHRLNTSVIVVNTDEFNQQLKPLLLQRFGKDLIGQALADEERLQAAIGQPWLELLKKALQNIPRGATAFIEIPYGLQSNKRMFRFIGGKIIYVGCADEEHEQQECTRRCLGRGTPELVPFIERIPGYSQSRVIAEQNKLQLFSISTAGTLAELQERIREFKAIIGKEGEDDGSYFYQDVARAFVR